MKMVWIMTQKELRSLFGSPLAYVVIGLFSAITGVIFFNLLVTYADQLQVVTAQLAQSQGISFMEEVVYKLFANINFLMVLFMPMITMKTLAEEKKTHSLDLYWLSPIKEWQVVAGKFFSIITLFICMLLIILVYPVVLMGAGINDLPHLASCFLGVFLNGVSYIALGILCSSLTDQTIVAGILSVIGIMMGWMLAWGGNVSSNYMISEILLYLSFTPHFERLIRGVISSNDLIFYVSFIGLMLFATVRNLQRRTW